MSSLSGSESGSDSDSDLGSDSDPPSFGPSSRSSHSRSRSRACLPNRKGRRERSVLLKDSHDNSLLNLQTPPHRLQKQRQRTVKAVVDDPKDASIPQGCRSLAHKSTELWSYRSPVRHSCCILFSRPKLPSTTYTDFHSSLTYSTGPT